MLLMPPTTGPVQFWSPVRFIARKAEWRARRNFTSVLFSWSHQATSPVRLDTAVHLWFGRMIRRTLRVPPCDARTGIVGTPQGNLQCFISHGTRTRPVQDPQGRRTTSLRTRNRIDTTRIDKNPARASYSAVRSPYGPLTVPARAVHVLFRISKPVRVP